MTSIMTNLIQYTRDKLGFTTSEFARQLGVSRITVDQWVRQIREPPAVAVTAMKLLLFVHSIDQHHELRIFLNYMDNQMNLTILINAVNEADSLSALASALNELETFIRQSENENLNSIDDVLKSSELKLFGGNDPEILGAYSWDDTGILFYENGEWCITPRSDFN